MSKTMQNSEISDDISRFGSSFKHRFQMLSLILFISKLIMIISIGLVITFTIYKTLHIGANR